MFSKRTLPSDRMAEDRQERLWLARTRWRLRGAWQWPAFLVLTLAGAFLLHELPFAGDKGFDIAAAFLLCGFANLLILAVLAPGVAFAWQKVRPGVVPDVARDRAATVLMGALFATFVVVGVAHKGAVDDAQARDAAQLSAVRRYVHNQAPEYLLGIGAESVWKQNATFYRTCVPSDRADRALCLFVDTSGPVPTVVRDPDQRPNSYVAGPDNPGRIGG